MRLNNATVLITGGTSGIGAALAHRFKAEGCTVIVCGRDEARLTAAADAIGVKAIRCDVSNLDDCKAMVQAVDWDHGGIDILVNCAGVMFPYEFASTDDAVQKVRAEIEINAIAPVTLTHLALPMLRKSAAPAVVFVSSGLAYAAFAPTPVYTGTKALIHHVAQTLRHQFKPLGIAVFELLPPVTDTPMAAGMNASAFSKSPPEAVVDELIRAMRRDVYEVPAGQSRQLRWLSRIAPQFLFNRMATALDRP